jgi:LacI family repressor for deo operon, udp, cdd, tsx, nupC, and nupG
MKTAAHSVTTLSRAKRAEMLIVVAPDLALPGLSDTLQGIESVANQHDYSVVVVNIRRSREGIVISLDPALMKHAAGVLLFGSDLTGEIVQTYRQRFIPWVLLHEWSPHQSLPSVQSDNLTDAFEAVHYLSQLGHQHIACLAGPSSSAVSQYRTQGYLQGVKRAGVQPEAGWIINSDYSITSGLQAFNQLFRHDLKPTALFCHHDLLALGALYQAKQRGIRVPQALSIIGFEGSSWAPYSDPPLTTVKQHHVEIGRQAALLLLVMAEKQTTEGQSRLLKSELIIRATTAPPYND